MPNQEPYCGVIIQKIYNHYRENIFVNITIPICLIGMILNLLNILVFTRKTMNSSPNLILAHLAFVDFLYLLTSIVNFCFQLILPKFDVYVVLFYELTIVDAYINIMETVFQFISAFLTVQLAAWRYIAVVHPLKERHWCNKKITRNVLITGYIVCCVLIAIPYHLSFDIDVENIDGEIYYIPTAWRHPIMTLIRDVIYGLVIKLLPSVVLAGLTSRITITLLARKNRRVQLTSSASTRSNINNAKMSQQTNRSTAILLAVAALFFIAEFPRGILWLLTTINEVAWRACYYSLTGIFTTLINIHASITFMVYCTLSQQFRTTLKFLFSRSPRTGISHQPHAPLALGDTEETDSGWKTSEV